MIVQVSGTDVQVGEAHDCGRLHVEAGPDDDVGSALELTLLGRLREDGVALMRTDELRRRAERDDPGWAERWDAMVGYAASRGWLVDDCLQAHVVRRPPA